MSPEDKAALQEIIWFCDRMPEGFMIMPDRLEEKRRLLKKGLISADHPMNYGTLMLVRPTEKGRQA